MGEWGPARLAVRDAVRKFLLALLSLLVMLGITLCILYGMALLGWGPATGVVVSGAALLTVPYVWCFVLSYLRRRLVQKLRALDLKGSHPVDVSITVLDQVIGRDVGFLLFRERTFAFVGLRSQFAFACENARLSQTLTNSYELVLTARHARGHNMIVLTPNDRPMFKAGRVAAIERSFEEHKRVQRPTGWQDVLPPAGIDPTVEVDTAVLRRHQWGWPVYACLWAIPIVTVAANLLLGHKPLAGLTPHTAAIPLIAWCHAVSDRRKLKARFEIHEGVRTGKISQYGRTFEFEPQARPRAQEPTV